MGYSSAPRGRQDGQVRLGRDIDLGLRQRRWLSDISISSIRATGALLEKFKRRARRSDSRKHLRSSRIISDETADSVYVGDLNGQMWRFDLTGTTGFYPQPVLLATADGPAAAWHNPSRPHH